MRRHASVSIAALLLAACGGGGQPQAPVDVNAIEVSAAAGAKPTVKIPPGAPPAGLQKRDIIVGTGAEAAGAKNVTVHYVGIAWSTREQFDASWDGGQPFPFNLAGGVITGWLQGIPGMRVGGRRLLVIPPELGYGAQGQGPIQGNETLVFAVDLLKVE